MIITKAGSTPSSIASIVAALHQTRQLVVRRRQQPSQRATEIAASNEGGRGGGVRAVDVGYRLQRRYGGADRGVSVVETLLSLLVVRDVVAVIAGARSSACMVCAKGGCAFVFAVAASAGG